jgi:hypothetical protein
MCPIFPHPQQRLSCSRLPTEQSAASALIPEPVVVIDYYVRTLLYQLGFTSDIEYLLAGLIKKLRLQLRLKRVINFDSYPK